ncbi:helix-turn-helix domain-containing protein [Glaciihabitans sp. INWT7]|uniref:helix-turn-helix domain-containing protein n=1 Tax=Glaciihabitans sp. INWT7 TaxID=2596912 RepID=UPI001629BCFF|nr:XRE family transcriptional regulator [Glaciihabitans sp. INWT7]QNE45807.1 helix-turn-helix domain-containing protein [Glaciihabitans sp. INWT7]
MDTLGTRLKELRRKSGLSLRELARQVDVSPSFVSQIENGKSQPSVATLYAFSRRLNVTVDELFEGRLAPTAEETVPAENGLTDPASAWRPSEFANRISVVHPSHRSRLDMAAGVVWERLAATPETSVSFMKILYKPGASSADTEELSRHAGYEYGYVTAGQLEVRIGEEVFVLNEGESLGFDSSIPHLFRNPGTVEMHGIWFVHGRGDHAEPTISEH